MKLLLFVFGISFFTLVCITNAATRQNIVIMIVDDQEYESLMQDPAPSDSEDPMPNLRRIVKNKGTTLENFFVTTPSCCISRATFLTGQYGHHCGVTGNTGKTGCYDNDWKNNKENATFATLIRGSETEGTYNTFYMGKYLNNYKTADPCPIPEGWDSWHGIMNGLYMGYTLCEGNYYDSPTGTPYTADPDLDSDYITLKMTEKANEFLAQQMEDKPFLMVLAPPGPHGSSVYLDEYDTMFDGMEAWTSEANDASHLDKHYMVRYLEEEDARRAAVNATPIDRNEMAQAANLKFVGRYRTLRHIDDMIANLSASIKFRNTYFMYTSDNGYHFNQHGHVHGKWMNFDTDIRVPFLIRGPNIPHNATIKQAVLNMDVAPTVLDIADLDKPDNMGGASFLDLVKTGSDSNWRTDFLAEYWTGAGAVVIPECDVSSSTYINSKGRNTSCCAITKEVPGSCSAACGDNCLNDNCTTTFGSYNTGSQCIGSVQGDSDFLCIREIKVESDVVTRNYAYCRFEDDGDNKYGTPFFEVYNIMDDPDQTTNLHLTSGVTAEEKAYYDGRIDSLKACDSSATCA